MPTKRVAAKASGSTKSTPKATSASKSPQKKSAKRKARSPSEDEEIDESDEDVDAYKEDEDDDEDVNSLHSDALDEDDEDMGSKRKRKRASKSPAKKKGSPKKAAPRKKRKKAESDDEVDDNEDGGVDSDGREIVGIVVQAPKTGRVPPGQISQNTFDFLSKLTDPACNDREWFKLHEPVYRLAEQEWKDFIEEFTTLLTEVDPQVPPLPPKDVIHRIYRDIRFSNDKTPYKRGFSASLSRSGRKGVFAGYHVLIKPGDESLLAAGTWCPGKNELATVRSHIQRSPARLRSVLSAPAFVELFGQPKPHPKGKRQSIFGMEDELKVAPKGIDKNHKDIDLLKCRSFAVSYKFTDAQVLAPDFKEELARVAEVVRPLVHCMNDMMTLPPDDDSDSDEEGEENREEE